MSSSTENIDSLSAEEILWPPKYDAMGVLMTLFTACIVGIIIGIIIILASYVTIWPFTLESGASPILLAFITFAGLTVGDLLYAYIIGRIFPHIYGRYQTGLAQVMIASIILYVFFIPVYLFVTSISGDMKSLLYAFAAHVVINSFFLTLVLGLVSSYRYAILSLYVSLISLLVTSLVSIFLQSFFSDSESALFMLLVLPALAFLLSTTLTTALSYLYYAIYESTWADPVGSVFARIETEEKSLEKAATNSLTQF
jgi:hypothetical protein